ncbi:peptidylprolyl isomerase SurA [Planctobacterium marinum]|uniref:Chaperone SurA n=1 Tax=Planctobacterium marinum TaxID=1631968 RepID=A0AA48KNE2_9ALTE|nr:chaperone SurA [Planctobacterium marinum]
MKLITVFSIFILSFSAFVKAQVQELDKVAVIVDQTVVLESEIKDLITTVKANAIRNNQNLPNDRVLRTQAIERLITEALQMQMAQRMGIQVSDPQLEQTIQNFASSENLTAEQLRAKVESEGMDWEQYRERIRKELITGEVTRANVRRRVYVTPQEIDNMVSLIDEQGAEEVEFQLGHILVGFPSEATQEDIDSAKTRSERVIELLQKEDADFRKIATTASSGPRALEGGDLGWMNVNTMPTLFAEVVADAKKDDLIGPIRSGAGFHILKILDIRGKQIAEIEEVNARHILIQTSVILSEERAQQMLSEFKNQVINGEAEFEDLAKEHSKDPGSAARGGELGWNDPSIYVPAFKETLAQLDEPGELSEPFRSVHGWHLVQLIGKRVGDVTDKLKQDKAYQLLFQRKFGEEREAWIRQMRDQAYVEVLE